MGGGTRAVVKRIVGAGAPARYARELAGLAIAARAAPALVPRVLATHDEHQLIVLEALAIADDEVPAWPAYARALARLHATAHMPAPSGSTPPGSGGVLPRAEVATEADAEAFLRLAAALSVPVTAAAHDQVHALLGRLAGTTPADLLHGDPCVGNAVVAGGRVRFIDLEGAALGDGLAELAYPRIAFPTCWSLFAPDEAALAAAEAAYRAEYRTLTGHDHGGSIADHCAGWLLRGDALVERAERGSRDQFARLVREDWRWGPTSARQRLAYRAGVVATLAGEDRGRLAEVSALAANVRAAVVARWPAAASLPARPHLPRG
jgi:aminoglycoside phosphotransferase